MFFYLLIWTWIYTPLTETEAKQVVDYLATQKQIVVYEKCEPSAVANTILLDSAYAQWNEKHRSYEIVVKGRSVKTFEIEQGTFKNVVLADSTHFHQEVDLANIYVLVRSNDNFYKVRSNLWDAQCLGIVLPIASYPCIDKFEFPVQE